ncbi:MAG TPA: hypothetical protein VHZ81_06775 [Galbitalea sp.]|jgi:hypothetical protein|nr:hypothetical protein [Galbitalea sp.]
MDLTPFLPTIGVIVGALATIGGVAINSRSTRKADDKKLALEVEREATRIRREDEAQRREDEALRQEAEAQRAQKQVDTYNTVAQLFVGELSVLRSARISDPEMKYGRFDKWFAKEWPPNADMRLRRNIADLSNDEHRLKITQICDAIMDQENVALVDWRDGGDQVEILLTLGFDLAATYARGQEPDEDLIKRWSAFRKQVAQAEEYKEHARLARIEALQKRAAEQAATITPEEDPF